MGACRGEKQNSSQIQVEKPAAFTCRSSRGSAAEVSESRISGGPAEVGSDGGMEAIGEGDAEAAAMEDERRFIGPAAEAEAMRRTESKNGMRSMIPNEKFVSENKQNFGQ